MWLDRLLLFMGSFRDLPGTLLKVGHKYLSPRCKPMRAAPAVTAAAGGLLRGSAPAPRCKGTNPLTNPSGPRSSFFLVYQTQLSIRGQGASMPLPARLESSKRCYWLC